MKTKTILMLTAAMAFSAVLAANVEVASPFADGMVLQRGMRVPVWGWADPGTQVTVSFAGTTRTATAGADRKWRVDLPPLEASKEGRELRVNDVTDYRPSIRPGDTLSVVRSTDRGYWIKKDGVTGWYTGELEYIE